MIHIFINILIFALIFIFVVILKQQIFISPYIENFNNNKPNTKRENKSNPYNLEDNLDDQNDGFVLAQQNAGNIKVLKDSVGHLEKLKNKVIDNSNKIKLLEVNLEEILQEQVNFSSKKAI